MIHPILYKRTFRDYLPIAAGATVILFIFVILFMFATNSIPLEEGRQWLKLDWIKKLINAMVGGDLAEALTPTGVSSFVFTHPFTWVLVIAFTLTISTGVLSGEMDRGTIDLLATLPISRPRLYVSVSAVILTYGLPLVFSAWLGVGVGARVAGLSHQADMTRLAIVGMNFYAAYMLIAGLSLCFSALFERRGVALTWCFLIIFYSFILNLLAAFWPVAQKISFSGFLHYYAPLRVVLGEAVPWGDMGVLLALAVIWWTAGLVIFCRRDIHVT